MTLGQKIRQARQGRKITQKELAARIGKSFSSVQKYEMDLATPPLETIEKIALSLGVPFLAFIDDRVKYLGVDESGVTFDMSMLDDDDENALVRLDEIKFLLRRLNERGRDKAVERIEELTEIPRYQAKRAAEATDTPSEEKGASEE